MDIKASAVDTADEIPESAWDRATRGRFAYDQPWHRFLEAQLIDYSPRYGLLHRGSSLNGLVFSRALSPGAVPKVLPPALQRVLEPLASTFVAVCGVPMAVSVDGIAVSQDVDDPVGMLQAGLRALDHVCQPPWRIAQIFQGPLGEGVRLGTELQRLGCHPLPAAPHTSLEIRWRSFEEYLGQLPSRRRKWIKKSIKRADKSGVEVRVCHPSDSDLPEGRLWELISNVFARHGSRPPFLREGFFAGLRRLPDDRAVYLAVLARGRPVGFAFGYWRHGAMGFPIVGLDYEVSKELRTVSLLYYRGIRVAIESELRELFMGVSNVEMKTRLGARLNERAWFVRSPQPQLNRLIQIGLRSAEARRRAETAS